MENINELIKQYKKYFRLAEFNFSEFQRTHDDDYMYSVNYYDEMREECGEKLKELGVDTYGLYSEAVEEMYS